MSLIFAAVRYQYGRCMTFLGMVQVTHCFGLNTQHSFQETQPWASSQALLCATFISLFIYFPSPYWANSRYYQLPLCNSAYHVADSGLPR